MKISAFCLSALLGAALLPGCRAKNPLLTPNAEFTPFPMQSVPPSAPQPVSPFAVTARAAQTEFEAGKPIELEIEVKNVSTASAELHFTSGQKFDFSATPAGQTGAVWSDGMTKRFAQVLSTQSLEAGRSLVFKSVWNGARPGTYDIDALVKANGGLPAARFGIVVK